MSFFQHWYGPVSRSGCGRAGEREFNWVGSGMVMVLRVGVKKIWHKLARISWLVVAIAIIYSTRRKYYNNGTCGGGV